MYSYTPASAKVNWYFQVNKLASSVNALTIANDGKVGFYKLVMGQDQEYRMK